MRLFPVGGDVPAVDHPEFGHFEPDADGGFTFPPALYDHLHRSAVGGRGQWETDIERQTRLIGEEHVRRQSPEALYEAVRELVDTAQTAKAQAAAPAKTAAAPAAKTAPAAAKTAAK
jgi:hypothetical protein